MSRSLPNALSRLFLLATAAALAACGVPGGGGATGDDDDDTVGPIDPLPPVLVEARARQAGMFGDHVRFDVVGHDPEANAPYLRVTLLDVSDAEVIRYDSDGDGTDDSGTTTLPMHVPVLSAADAPGVLYMPDLQRFTFEAVRFEVALVDHQGLASDTIGVELEMQEVVPLGETCDPTFVASRCADGMSCVGDTPPTCAEGEAPVVARAAYLSDDLGPRILVEGTDADDDVRSVRIAFQNADGGGVSIDLDGDGTPDADHFVFERLRISSTGAFFYRLDPSAHFTTLVDRVAIEVTDLGGRRSEVASADLASADLRNIGADCDPRGFDICRNSVCMPGVVGERNRCQRTETAQRQACTTAPELVPTAGPQQIRGVVAQPSLWDAPAGCVSGDPKLRADAVVKLTLERDVALLGVSTGDPHTSFDTVVYLLDECTGTPVLAWCQDDERDAPRPWLARMRVENVPAGTYYLVIDSFQSIAQGDFQLDVVAQ